MTFVQVAEPKLAEVEVPHAVCDLFECNVGLRYAKPLTDPAPIH